MKIVIAEDQPVAALYLRRSLEKMGHQADVAPDGEAAWRMIRDGDASLLISDWMMPHLDGLELCRRLRSAGSERYIYIILLTSLDRREDRVKGLRAGADDFLTKPPDPDELAVRLEIAERILAVHDQLARQNARLAELASTDELTGVKNRRRFREDLDLFFSQAHRQGFPLSLILLDIDHFKPYNDAFGHPAGDLVLQKVGLLLRSIVRGHDVVARYGGEEFVVLLPTTGPTQARDMAERLRHAIAAQDWPHRPVTASFGVATTEPDTPDAATLVDQADRALYLAKEAGRDRTVVGSLAASPLAPVVSGQWSVGRRPMAVRHYTDLIAWQKAMDLVVRVYEATEGFPTRERFGLTNQIRRAAVSVPSNIAEGQGRDTTRDFLRCLSIASGSLQELETQLIIARRLNYLDQSLQPGLSELTNEVARLINGLKNSLARLI